MDGDLRPRIAECPIARRPAQPWAESTYGAAAWMGVIARCSAAGCRASAACMIFWCAHVIIQKGSTPQICRVPPRVGAPRRHEAALRRRRVHSRATGTIQSGNTPNTFRALRVTAGSLLHSQRSRDLRDGPLAICSFLPLWAGVRSFGPSACAAHRCTTAAGCTVESRWCLRPQGHNCSQPHTPAAASSRHRRLLVHLNARRRGCGADVQEGSMHCRSYRDHPTGLPVQLDPARSHAHARSPEFNCFSA